MLIPKDNEKDLADIPDNVKRGLRIIPVAMVDEVLEKALAGPLVPIEWVEPEEPVARAAKADGEPAGVITH